MCKERLLCSSAYSQAAVKSGMKLAIRWKKDSRGTRWDLLAIINREYLIVSWKASKAGEVFTWHHTDLTEKEN